MNSVFNTYRTDVWHTHESRELICKTSSLERSIELLEQFCKNMNEQLSEDDLHLLRTIKQTQNHEGGGEFLIEEVTLNELI